MWVTGLLACSRDQEKPDMAPIVSHMHRCMYRWMDGPKQGRAGAAERSKWIARRDKEGKMGV